MEQQQSGWRKLTFGRFHDVARAHVALMDAVRRPPPPTVPHAEEGPAWEEWELFEQADLEAVLKIEEHAVVTIIFACAACELYINDAGARLLGDTYFAKHVDRLDLLSKWVLVPKLIKGHEIDRGGRAFELLKRLVGLRNELMHPKSAPVELEQIKFSNEPPRAASAHEAIEALDRLGEEAEKFDERAGSGLFDADEHSRRQLIRAGFEGPR